MESLNFPSIMRLIFLFLLALFFYFVIYVLNRDLDGKSRKSKSKSKRKNPLLIVEGGEEKLGVEKGHSFEVEDSCTIGRNRENSVIINDPSSSNFHAVITRKRKGFYIADHNSRNGTLVNDREVKKEMLLRPGDLITIGDTILRFEIR